MYKLFSAGQSVDPWEIFVKPARTPFSGFLCSAGREVFVTLRTCTSEVNRAVISVSLHNIGKFYVSKNYIITTVVYSYSCE